MRTLLFEYSEHIATKKNSVQLNPGERSGVGAAYPDTYLEIRAVDAQ
jgi:hypothetical protein